jgi:chromate transport protein ChrA
MQMSVARPAEDIAPSDRSLTRMILYFPKLGTVGFGGPIALAGYMQRLGG